MASAEFSAKQAQPYLINVGDADKMRATALNLIFDPHSIGFFPFDKIKSSDKILFAGCGNGQLVVEIAKEMKMRNLNVQIVAFDISQPQLDCAQKYAEQEGVHVITWKHQDAHNLEEFRGQFNVVHARFLLNHLADADVVANMLCDTLSENGVFIGEEFGGDDVDVLPQSAEYIDTINVWLKGVRLQHMLQKSNMAFAKHLPEILRNKNMVVTREIQPNPVADNEEQKNVFPECMASAHRIFPADQCHTIPAIKAALENVRDSKECSIIFKHFTQIEAKKAA
jgi:SAM-dependent methyltransferase